jgi:hypothetical protein
LAAVHRVVWRAARRQWTQRGAVSAESLGAPRVELSHDGEHELHVVIHGIEVLALAQDEGLTDGVLKQAAADAAASRSAIRRVRRKLAGI